MANFWDSVSRFGVPVFVMISGAIFLSKNKQVTAKKLWLGNILRMLIVFGVWSFAYYAYQSLYYWDFDFWRQGIVRTVTGCVYASDHFWFIFMIIGLYALVPFLRTWVHNASRRELDQFVILFLIFQVGRTTVTGLLDKSLITKISDMVTILELSGYLGYFVLGYILSNYSVERKKKIWIYALVPISIVINYVVSQYMSMKAGYYSPGIYDSFGVFTFIISVALFLFITEKSGQSKMGAGGQKVVTNLAQDTLGIYVMHVGVLDFISSRNFIVGNVSPMLGIPVLSIGCFVICMAAAELLRRIPKIGKYIC